ncbi:MAG TPA: hypothetical protein P5572_22095 [Phycisphaerae bacterium]|nr:hypothetical protein [Phycisphaerales bacterium]HRX87728.1 hypothetical protein [Phycisphaerae bacterium]
MADAVVAVCPSCSQKYRVDRSNIGAHARCRKCGQTFKLLEEPPIDDETIFGWVTDDDPSASSVLGGTGVVGYRFNAATQVPAHNGWVHPPPPDQPRVDFEELAEDGAYFSFAPADLRDRDLRCSFPHRCAQCLSREDLELHYVLWLEKVPPSDAALISETETRTHRILKLLMETHGLDWFNALEPLNTLPPPFKEPIPYAICPQCSVPGAVRGRVTGEGPDERCRLIIAHPTIALEFYRNNGGRGTPGYQKLLVASRQRKDNQWKALAAGVRIRINQWYHPQGGERFLGFFADRDFDRTERGTAGLVLTDRRLIYKKYAALREYALTQNGTLDIEADRAMASVEILQPDKPAAVLSTTPLAASSLARTLSSLNRNWQIQVTTRS